MNSLSRAFVAISVIWVMTVSAIVWRCFSPTKGGMGSVGRPAFQPAKSPLAMVDKEIGEEIGEIPTAASGFNIPLHVFITDSRGVAIGAWVHLQIKTATVGQAMGSAFRQMANKASEPTWPTTTNELRWFPPEGEVFVAAERKMNVWITKVPVPAPAGSQLTPSGARVVVRRVK